MGFSDLIRSLLGQKTANPAITEIKLPQPIPVEYQVELQKNAFYLCRDYIASAVSKCEFRTFAKGQEAFGEEYYSFNVRPNSYQSATEFWRELIFKLYDNSEVLSVRSDDGQYIIADGFSKQDFALRAAEFSGVSRGGFTFSRVFRSGEVLYYTINQGESLRGLLSGVNSIVNSTLSEAVEKYHKEGGERGTLKLDSMQTGDEAYQARVNNLLNSGFKDYYKSKYAVIPIYDGMDYSPIVSPATSQKTSIVSDITGLLDTAIRVQAQTMKIPPVLLLGDIADSKTAVQNFLTFCIDPLLDMITEGLNNTLYGFDGYRDGFYITADTSAVEHMDMFSIAASIDKLRAASIASANEIRRKIHEPRIDEPWADAYVMTKNYEGVNGNADV